MSTVTIEIAGDVAEDKFDCWLEVSVWSTQYCWLGHIIIKLIYHIADHANLLVVSVISRLGNIGIGVGVYLMLYPPVNL